MTEEKKEIIEWIKKRLWETGTDLEEEELSEWNHNYFKAICFLDDVSKKEE